MFWSIMCNTQHMPYSIWCLIRWRYNLSFKPGHFESRRVLLMSLPGNRCHQKVPDKQETMSPCVERPTIKYLLNEWITAFWKRSPRRDDIITSKQQVSQGESKERKVKTVLSGRGIDHIRLYFLSSSHFPLDKKNILYAWSTQGGHTHK